MKKFEEFRLYANVDGTLMMPIQVEYIVEEDLYKIEAVMYNRSKDGLRLENLGEKTMYIEAVFTNQWILQDEETTHAGL